MTLVGGFGILGLVRVPDSLLRICFDLLGAGPSWHLGELPATSEDDTFEGPES